MRVIKMLLVVPVGLLAVVMMLLWIVAAGYFVLIPCAIVHGGCAICGIAPPSWAKSIDPGAVMLWPIEILEKRRAKA